jgi:hypothetical protein
VAAFGRNHWQPFIGMGGRVCAGLSNANSEVFMVAQETTLRFLKTVLTMLDKINLSINQVQERKVTKVETEEELNQSLDNL